MRHVVVGAGVLVATLLLAALAHTVLGSTSDQGAAPPALNAAPRSQPAPVAASRPFSSSSRVLRTQRSAADAARPVGARHLALSSAYGRLPLAFEQNRGQDDPRVKFVSRGAGYALALTQRGPLLSVSRSVGDGASRGTRPSGRTALVGMTFVGGSARARLVPSARLPGQVNYLIGRNRRHWHTGLATYASVSYRGVWPGVDATFYGNQSRLEYDFRLRAGTSPGRIALAFNGARRLRLDRRGDLVIGLRGGSVRELAPRAYQVIAGRRAPVASRYVILPRRRVGVSVGKFDRRRALVIDPALVYSTFLGGSGNDFGWSLAIDPSGDAYVTGYTQSTDFPTTPGAFMSAASTPSDAFVAKLNPTGTALVYSTYLGGNAADFAAKIAVDSTGDAYVVGNTNSPDFPVTAGAAQSTYGGNTDAFVAKLNPTGSGLLYATYLGGSGFEYLNPGIATDSKGDAYVVGGTQSTNFPTTPGAFQTTYPGGTVDGYVVELNPTGTKFLYATYLGGSGKGGAGTAVKLDASGNAYVSGYTGSADFPVTAGAAQTTLGGGNTDAFVAKVNAAGSGLAYATYLGGTGDDAANGIALDSSGHAYLSGQTNSADFPTTSGAFQTTYGGAAAGLAGDAFVAKLNPTGSGVVYSTYLGGSGNDKGNEIAIDSLGDAYVTGNTASPNFPTTPGAFQTTFGGDLNFGSLGDAFVTKVNPTGSGLIYSTYLGGTNGDFGEGIAVDGDGNAYISGSTTSSNFPTIPGAFQSMHATGNAYDGFVAKLLTTRRTSMSVSCAPPSILISTATTCTAMVTDTDVSPAATPTGTVGFATNASGAFGSSASCPLSATATAGAASCSVSYTPSREGPHTVTATYSGDPSHTTGSGSTIVTVNLPTKPSLASVRMTHTRFSVGPEPTAIVAANGHRSSVGTIFEFSLSKAADLSILIARLGEGRLAGKRCVRTTHALRRHKRCALFATSGTLTRRAKGAGAGSVPFSGRIGTRALKPSHYRATLTATDSAGRRSTPVVVRFTIVRR